MSQFRVINPLVIKFSHDKKVKIDKELDKMIKKRIIEEININDAAYISNIFTRPKSDESLRVILRFNKPK